MAGSSKQECHFLDTHCIVLSKGKGEVRKRKGAGLKQPKSKTANSKIQKVTLFPFYSVQYNHELRDKHQKDGELTEEIEDIVYVQKPWN